ncbi:MAG: metallophosphoesterase [Holosporales bacterium]|jgi:hypothetical protein|nr:metallophosphoesterase [Holosporales bacterium]
MYRKSLNILFGLSCLAFFSAEVEATHHPSPQPGQTNVAVNSKGNLHLPGKPNIRFNESHLNDTTTSEREAVIVPNHAPPIKNMRVGGPCVQVGKPLYEHQVIGLADLHTDREYFGPDVRNSLLELINAIIQNNGDRNVCVIAGDCAQRRDEQPDKLHRTDKLSGAAMEDFLRKLRKKFGTRLFVGLGNHDTQIPSEFYAFLETLGELEITVLTSMRGFFSEEVPSWDSFHGRKLCNITDYAICNGILLFPFCFNFANGGGFGDFSGVFTLKAERALLNIERDGYERSGKPYSLRYNYDAPHEKPYYRFAEWLQRCMDAGEQNNWQGDWQGEQPGAPNILVLDWLKKFKKAVRELERVQQQLGNTTGKLDVVFVVHDYYLHFLDFLERASQIDPKGLGIDPSLLRRLNVVAVCGHSHKLYSSKKDIYITASDGSVVPVPAILGGPGFYGNGVWTANLDWNGDALPKTSTADSEPKVWSAKRVPGADRVAAPEITIRSGHPLAHELKQLIGLLSSGAETQLAMVREFVEEFCNKVVWWLMTNGRQAYDNWFAMHPGLFWFVRMANQKGRGAELLELIRRFSNVPCTCLRGWFSTDAEGHIVYNVGLRGGLNVKEGLNVLTKSECRYGYAELASGQCPS